MLIVGVDGCRGGWIAADSDSNVQLFEHFESLVTHYVESQQEVQFLVDMPMGLKQSAPRDVEKQARALLPGKSSSVFAVPCRDAVYADSYQSACDINARTFGSKLSKQVWNICPKIKEVDGHLRSHPENTKQIFECHPELTFALLSQQKLVSSKKTDQGIQDRLKLLSKYLPSAKDMYQQAIDATLRKHVARDDVLDAMVLLVCGQIGFDLIVDAEGSDEFGIPVRLALVDSIC